MLDTLLKAIAPHLCYSCGAVGSVFCEDCKYNIVDEPFDPCVFCGDRGCITKLAPCPSLIARQWCLGERNGPLKELVSALKFARVRAAHIALAEMLSYRIGILPDNVVIVPVPTTPTRARQRGYDQAMLIARHLAKRQHSTMEPLLRRTASFEQKHASRADRFRQAEHAFYTKRLNGGTYLLIDDIVTTGATLRAAAQTLRNAGASDIWAAVAVYHPLD